MMEGRCFLFLLFFLVPALTQDSICPADFVAIDGCCYYFSTEKVGFDEAKYECDYLDGELVTFDDCETLEDVLESGENCPYWVHPTTYLDCLDPYPMDVNKYICKVQEETRCEAYCDGVCKYTNIMFQCDGPDEEWVFDSRCSCPENQRCCVNTTTSRSCLLSPECQGDCLYPDDTMDNLGCLGDLMDPDRCPCPDEMICCCNKTEEPPPTEATPCPVTDKPLLVDINGCGRPEASVISDDQVFNFDAVYEALAEYESDPYAADVKFDQVKEQLEKLGGQDGESLSGMSGDLTDAVRAEKDVWVLQYTDSDDGYEMGIMLRDFVPEAGVLPDDLDFSDPAFSYEFKDKLTLLKQRYAALKLNVNIPDFIPGGCNFIPLIRLNEHFSLVRVPLVLITCVTIECQVVIVVPVVCFEITCTWVGDPYCYWEFQIRIVIKKLIIFLTYWVRFWWINAFPAIAIQPIPDCPDPGVGEIAPFEEFQPGLMETAMENFNLPEDMAAELYLNEFRAVYDMDLGEQGGTALSTMEGSVTSRVNGFSGRWALAYRESDDDMETTILLDEGFDPEVDELPDELELGDISGLSYSQRYLLLFSQRYREMRASVSLRLIFPTDCGTGVHSLRLDLRFRLLRIPFFLIACWEIRITEFLIIPVPCFEIFYICGIRVVIPVIKLIIIRRTFWLGLWVWPLPAPCPWPPAPTPGSAIAFLNPTGLSHGDTCRYVCRRGWQPCPPYFNPLVCLWGQWWWQPLQLHCSRDCPPPPAPGFGAIRTFWGSVRGRRRPTRVKEICIYRCFPGWVPCFGSRVRLCINGIWIGWPLICFPKWILIPFPPLPPVRPPRPPIGDPHLPCDCKDIYDMDSTLSSGVYMIYPNDGECGFEVYCDMETDGGGWTVFQRRQDGSVDFYLDWNDYKHGFPSNLTDEFWLGNDKIHRLTAQKDYRMRVDLENNNGDAAFAEYDEFKITNEAGNYRLTISGYSGTAGDSMTSSSGGQDLNGQAFSTYDDDNDVYPDGSCAVRFHGAWWYCACAESNLNGEYGSTDFGKGVIWKTYGGMRESMSFTEMKIRP